MKKSIILTLLAFCTSFSAATFAAEPTGDATFQDLLKQFPKGNLPYSISVEQLKHELLVRYDIEKEAETQKKVARLTSKYRTLLPDMSYFGRSPLLPTPIAALETSTHYALVYTFDRDRDYRVAIYNKKGAFLHKRTLTSAYGELIQSAILDENLKATISKHLIVWEKDVKKEGFRDNKIKSIKLLKTEIVDMTVEEKTEKPVVPQPNAPIVPKAPPAKQQKQPAIIRA